MDRRSQLLAPTKKTGGVRRAYRPENTNKSVNFKATLDTFKNELSPTVLKTCSYKTEDKIVTYDSAKIQSITSRGNKHVCFLVTGDANIISEDAALNNMPKDIEKTLRNIKARENTPEAETPSESPGAEISDENK